MQDIAWMGSHFSSWSHREFILLSVLPVLTAALAGKRGALAGKRGALDGWRLPLQSIDRRLLDALPAIGRYCWETVIVLER